jgi:hypothetical protein
VISIDDHSVTLLGITDLADGQEAGNQNWMFIV